jgi:hypothetical protein
MKREIVAMTLGSLLLASTAIADTVKTKENKQYIRWNETSTDLEYKQKDGWQFKENKIRVYEEVNQDKKENKRERKNR